MLDNQYSFNKPPKTNHVSESNKVDIFTEFFQHDSNLTLWHRTLSPKLKAAISQLLNVNQPLEIKKNVSPDCVYNILLKALPNTEHINDLIDDMAKLVKIFCDLFAQKEVILRLGIITNTTCPRFHVDNVSCRLISNYYGACTQWLDNNEVDRSKLGSGNNGLADECSGLFKNLKCIHHLTVGDVALMKGKLWPNNENYGLVHRSPTLNEGEKRLLFTLDSV